MIEIVKGTKLTPKEAFALKEEPLYIDSTNPQHEKKLENLDKKVVPPKKEVAKVGTTQEKPDDPAEKKPTKQGGRINKNLIYGIAASVVLGFLLFNFVLVPGAQASRLSTNSKINERIPDYSGDISRSTPLNESGDQIIETTFAPTPRSRNSSTPDIDEEDFLQSLNAEDQEPEVSVSPPVIVNRRQQPETRPPSTPTSTPPVRSTPVQTPVIQPRYTDQQAGSQIGVSVGSPDFPEGVGQSTGFGTNQTVSGSFQPTDTNTNQLSVYDVYEQANNQSQKEAFAQTTPPAIEGIVDQYSIAPGTIIPAVLVTGLNTDLPGYIIARVSQNVFDHPTGQNLLIPAGTQLLARYNSVVTYGQTRVQIAWQSFTRPDGVTVNLGNALGVDPQGFAGVEAQVNEHGFEIGGSILLSSLVTLLNGVSSNLISQLLAQGALSDSVNQALALTTGITNEAIQRWLNVQPTLSLPSGTTLSVLVADRVTLPPAEYNLTNAPYIRR